MPFINSITPIFCRLVKYINASGMAALLATVGVIGFSSASLASDAPAIAAAANIKFAVDEIATRFQQQTGLELRISYGSSGNFITQIQHGAPFEMMLSADEGYIDKLHQAGFTQDEGIVYAIGRLALAAPKASPLILDPELVGLRQLIDDGKLSRFAIANPDHAPYGVSAREVLKAKGLWDALQPMLILGENAGQATQFTISGSTQGGIVPLSLVLTPEFAKRGNYVIIPDVLFQPLNQRMALMPQASETAERFYQYMQSNEARQVLTQFGFNLPKPVVKQGD
ncbi:MULTISPECIES: molybdate ABC transporter substrate-binding protein [Shewanella]|uniref:molybdate ABC transporter substrate-binding protein n=1 Tax=Shewanella TaxID=22 RepID=UPI000C5EAADC|nr:MULTISPECIES: molybdate ABC transporter substrate-binding protein [Shewanella]PIQ01525.1 MAG: molybdate ABC transporter substrate-binding protein [Shewanella sp. CG18_big_fil_WC_8_21_14_2_50_42_11]PIX70380.1 MAG: molybdate ABC transporter substrate-binding protein [Shewanella sp. CG_4_10_14_3_um_filter_42_91]PIY67630.1 MAG: molybdate ABC transporter substrate-binding protein [Shewanella sp. CG_4_10_14_0_8_um_filter_42_13]PJB91761.1 MAG: molybdate ABC transporter substrate-binding protein [Sh